MQIRASENDIGAISGDDADNCYIIEDNFLVYGKGKDDFQTIADNIMSKIKGIMYRPYQAAVQGNPCYEVGDAVRLFTKYELIESYILSRTLKGIQALKDSFTAKGEERYDEKVNSVRKSIIQLKGKTNELERTVEETKSTITDVEKGLQSQITQNAESITAEVKRATDAETQLSSKISINADNITAEVTRAQGKEEQLSSSIKINVDNITAEVRRATSAEGELSSKISANADNITAEVTRATKAEGELSGKISVNADNITAEVKRAQGQEVKLAAAIKINADNILLKVSKGNISSEISQEAGKISIKSNRISIESDNFTLSEDGSIKAKNGEFSGKITVGEGTIGGFTITNNSIYNGKSSISSTTNGVFISTKGINIGDYDNYIKADTGGTTPSIEIKIGNSTISSSTIHLQKSGVSYPYIDFVSSGIELYSTSQIYTKINSDGITLQPTYNTRIKLNSNGVVSETGNISLIAYSSNTAILGNSSNKIGFFGSNGATKKYVGTLSDTPTVDNLKTKLNALINALKDYNLIS